MFAHVQEELEARKSLRPFFSQLKSQLNILIILKTHKLRSTTGNRKKKHIKTIIVQAYQSRCRSWRSSNEARIAWDFQPSLYASSRGKWISSFFKTTPSEIGFPMTLTSGAFLNQKRNKQTSHELQNNLDSSCISFCISSRKRQFKTSEDDTKLCQLQLSVRKFPDAT